MGEVKKKSIYQEAVEKMDPEDISNWQSDLYLKKNPISIELVKSYQFKENVKGFVSQIDNEIWFDIPFAFDPYWEKKPR